MLVLKAFVAGLLLLASAPALAGTICDDLGAAMQRGDGSRLSDIARQSGGRIQEIKSGSKVPAQYKLPDWGNTQVHEAARGLVASVETQGTMHCQQWAFFRSVNGKVQRVKAPPIVTNEEGGMCWDSYGGMYHFGGVPALVVESDGDNQVTLDVTPWQGASWGKACRVSAKFAPDLKVDGAFCATPSCAPLDHEAVALARWYRGFVPGDTYPKQGVDQRITAMANSLGNLKLIPEFGKSTSNPYSQFADEKAVAVQVNGETLLALVGGGLFGWRDYRGNLVGFWRAEKGKLMPVAGFQLDLTDAKPISVTVK